MTVVKAILVRRRAHRAVHAAVRGGSGRGLSTSAFLDKTGALLEKVIGAEEVAACAAILETTRRVHSKVGLSNRWVSPVGLATGLWCYHKNQPPKDADCTGAPLVDAAPHGRWMVLSAATYGRLINWGLGLFKGAATLLEKAAAEAADGRGEDVFLAAAAETCGCTVLGHSLALQPGMYKPAYVIFDDREQKAVVVAIRGTSNLREVLADLVCVPQQVPAEELFFGATHPEPVFVHGGMWRAAKILAEGLRSPVGELLESRPGYRVMLTGHSLGAGVACLLCLMWRPWLGDRAQAVTFATPQVLDLAAARAAAERGVTSVVLSGDVVPRLSLHSAEAMLAEVARAGDEHEEKTWWNRARAALAGSAGAEQGPASGAGEEEAPAVPLFPPGRLLYLPDVPPAHPAGGEQQGDALRAPAYVVDQEAFASIRVSSSMLIAHFQTSYLRALAWPH